MHCFAEPGAEGGEACRHDPRAASRAFAIMELFLRERFAAP
ncbi:MAG: hypothetical protein RML12_04635 [Xanthomonadales bacterium]|nr:hypothetical protein [Xanthomonadales bacterium]